MKNFIFNPDQSCIIKIMPHNTGKYTALIDYIMLNTYHEEEVLFVIENEELKEYYKKFLIFSELNAITFKQFSDNVLNMTFELYLNILKQYKLIVFVDINKEEALIFANACYLLIQGIKIVFLSDEVK